MGANTQFKALARTSQFVQKVRELENQLLDDVFDNSTDYLNALQLAYYNTESRSTFFFLLPHNRIAVLDFTNTHRLDSWHELIQARVVGKPPRRFGSGTAEVYAVSQTEHAEILTAIQSHSSIPDYPVPPLDPICDYLSVMPIKAGDQRYQQLLNEANFASNLYIAALSLSYDDLEYMANQGWGKYIYIEATLADNLHAILESHRHLESVDTERYLVHACIVGKTPRRIQIGTTNFDIVSIKRRNQILSALCSGRYQPQLRTKL